MRSLVLGCALVLLAALASGPARAEAFGSLRVDVRTEDGEAVADAVVYAVAVGETAGPVEPSPTAIDQVDKEYVPYVTAIGVGTPVHFPNYDSVRHHVYSFSEAKTFEIPLYKGTPPEPVVFDRPGPVVLGCNIHDWMKAYVYVMDTPHYVLTKASGAAEMQAVPTGEYDVFVWHPRLSGEPEATRQRVEIGPGAASALSFTIVEKRVWRPRRAPSALGVAGYR